MSKAYADRTSMNALRRLRQQPKFVIVAAGLSSVILLGLLDYVTGPEVSLSVFYLLPITAVTWLTDR